MRILVTGGSGFIGRHLVAAIAARGDQVLSIDKPPWPTQWTWLELDLIYHLAAISSIGKSYEDPAETIRINVGGTIEIVQQACCPVVLASTMNEGPSPYTVSKRAAELCMRPGDSILQIANVYGPGGHGVVDIFKRADAIGDILRVEGGQQLKDFVHVDDVVNALLNIKPGTTCVCSQSLVSIDGLRKMFPASLWQECPEQPGEVSQRPRTSDYPCTRKLEEYVKE